MITTVSKRGQTSIPAKIRKKFGIEPNSKLIWIVNDEKIRVVPISADPIAAFRGMGKGESLTKLLLEERRKDRERERKKYKRYESKEKKR